MELRGSITRWVKDRGFGFIKPDPESVGEIYLHDASAGHPAALDVFAHISDFRMEDNLKSPEPKARDRVVFSLAVDQKTGRRKAVSIYYEGDSNG